MGSPRSQKTANIPKMADKCMSARPTPPHTNPMEWGPGRRFLAQNNKTQKDHDFRPKKRGGHFFTTPPPHPTLISSKKWVSSAGGLGGSGPKTHWGMCLLDKIMILKKVKNNN